MVEVVCDLWDHIIIGSVAFSLLSLLDPLFLSHEDTQEGL